MLRYSFRIVVYLVAFPHELLHYLPARVLGLKAYIEPGITWVQKDVPLWKDLIATLCPTAAGLIMQVAFACKLLTADGDKTIWWFANAFALVWIIGCLGDIYIAIKAIQEDRAASCITSFKELMQLKRIWPPELPSEPSVDHRQN